MSDREWKQQVDEYERQVLTAIEKVIVIIANLNKRLDALEGRTSGEPRQPGPPNYMSGRWYMRSGMGFGGPPGS